jgi:hypothetical protein
MLWQAIRIRSVALEDLQTNSYCFTILNYYEILRIINKKYHWIKVKYKILRIIDTTKIFFNRDPVDRKKI